MMRLSIKALHPSSWGESQGGGRPRIEQVVWHPVESGNWAPDRVAAISDKRKEKRNENGEGRVLYSFAQDRHGRRGGGEHDERGMQPHDVLTLTFPFLCPETESSQALSLGHMRLYWRVVSTSSSSFPSSSFSEKPTAATTASPSSSSWLACTEAECPIVGVVAPDIIVHLHAPSDVILGQAFKLRWTLRNLTEKVLTIRVVLKEGGGEFGSLHGRGVGVEWGEGERGADFTTRIDTFAVSCCGGAYGAHSLASVGFDADARRCCC